ncbi:uncharacterized protein [Branchiostoma lanceolatum]|uniref:uncharacterized protein n=1 Tax=Branchiostoma lanceolatum TaxID=7740 RepID=UPI003451EDC6
MAHYYHPGPGPPGARPGPRPPSAGPGPPSQGVSSPPPPPPGPQLNRSIHDAIQQYDIPSCERLVTEHPECVNEKGWYGFSPLHQVCMRGLPQLMELLLAHGAEVDATNDYGETALHYACKRGIPVFVHQLIEKGASVRTTDKKGWNAMHHAASGGSIHIMHYLSEVCGLGFRDKDNNGQTVMHIVCSGLANLEAFQYCLREQRCDPTLPDLEGNTPLHLAAKMGQGVFCWNLLTICGCQLLQVPNRQGHLPVDLARQGNTFKHRDIASTLSYFMNRRSKDASVAGPVGAWWALLLTPTVVPVFAYSLEQWIPFYGSLMTVVVLGLMLVVVFQQTHRLQHATRWANPTYIGAFAGGLFHTAACFYYKVLPAIWPQLFLSVCGVAGTLICFPMFYILIRSEPGYVKRPKVNEEGRTMTIKDVGEGTCGLTDFCGTCEMVKPVMAKHCKLCEKCVSGLDHHCLFLYNCVARNNHRLFVTFIQFVLLTQATFVCSAVLYFGQVYASSTIWEAVPTIVTGDVWVASLLLVNCLCLFWGCNLLSQQYSVVLKGYTTVQSPPTLMPMDLSFKGQVNNLVNFYLHRRPHIDYDVQPAWT